MVDFCVLWFGAEVCLFEFGVALWWACLFWFRFRFVLRLDVWAVWCLGCYLAAGCFGCCVVYLWLLLVVSVWFVTCCCCFCCVFKVWRLGVNSVVCAAIMICVLLIYCLFVWVGYLVFWLLADLFL